MQLSKCSVTSSGTSQPTCGQLVWSSHQCIGWTNLLPFTISHLLGGVLLRGSFSVSHWCDLEIWTHRWPYSTFGVHIFSLLHTTTNCWSPTRTSGAVMSELCNRLAANDCPVSSSRSKRCLHSGPASFKVPIWRAERSQCCVKYCPNSKDTPSAHFKCHCFWLVWVCTSSTLCTLRYLRMLCVYCSCLFCKDRTLLTFFSEGFLLILSFKVMYVNHNN